LEAFAPRPVKQRDADAVVDEGEQADGAGNDGRRWSDQGPRPERQPARTTTGRGQAGGANGVATASGEPGDDGSDTSSDDSRKRKSDDKNDDARSPKRRKYSSSSESESESDDDEYAKVPSESEDGSQKAAPGGSPISAPPPVNISKSVYAGASQPKSPAASSGGQKFVLPSTSERHRSRSQQKRTNKEQRFINSHIQTRILNDDGDVRQYYDDAVEEGRFAPVIAEPEVVERMDVMLAQNGPDHVWFNGKDIRQHFPDRPRAPRDHEPEVRDPPAT